jgi:hypothetical protein
VAVFLVFNIIVITIFHGSSIVKPLTKNSDRGSCLETTLFNGGKFWTRDLFPSLLTD